jgi:Protein of unknown function (DUF3037)
MKGQYSLIQYAENPERLEFVNIGVVIFVPFGKGVYSKFSDSPRRVNKAFGVSLGVHYKVLIQSFESRIRNDFEDSAQHSKLEYFASNRSGKIRLSPLRSMLVKEPESALEDLYNSLVNDVDVSPKRKRVDYKLRDLFRFEKIEQLLDRPEKIQIKHFSLQPDYGYQNGSYNYIKAVSLHGEPNEALHKISEYAIKGRLIAADEPLLHRKKLIVVGDGSDQKPSVVEDIGSVLMNHEVEFYSLDNASSLLEDIKKNAAIHQRMN